MEERVIVRINGEFSLVKNLGETPPSEHYTPFIIFSYFLFVLLVLFVLLSSMSSLFSMSSTRWLFLGKLYTEEELERALPSSRGRR